jgi:TonB family protein
LTELKNQFVIGTNKCKTMIVKTIVKSSIKTRFLMKPMFIVLVVILVWNPFPTAPASAQTSQPQTSARKLKVSVPPEYPELARKMNIQGLARVLVTVVPDGAVAGVKELGGNPILVDALVQAVRKWKYEATDHESQIEVRYEFVLGH